MDKKPFSDNVLHENLNEKYVIPTLEISWAFPVFFPECVQVEVEVSSIPICLFQGLDDSLWVQPGLVTTSILFCWIFTIKDQH